VGLSGRSGEGMDEDVLRGHYQQWQSLWEGESFLLSPCFQYLCFSVSFEFLKYGSERNVKSRFQNYRRGSDVLELWVYIPVRG
jgi:hypothetical protein